MNNGKGRRKGSNNDVSISSSGNFHANQNSNSVGEHDDGDKGHKGKGRSNETMIDEEKPSWTMEIKVFSRTLPLSNHTDVADVRKAVGYSKYPSCK